jgi:PAS domain S-box-containing protein
MSQGGDTVARTARVPRIETREDPVVGLLGYLRVAAVQTDARGRILHVNDSARTLFGRGVDELNGERLSALARFRKGDVERLRVMVERPTTQRETLTLRFTGGSGRTYRVEVDAVDDPRNDRRRLLFFYDVTELHELRRLRESLSRAIARWRSAIGERPPISSAPQSVASSPAARPTEEDERQRIRAALRAAGQNRSEAARLLGISRATFYRRLGALGIAPDEEAG